MTAFSPRQQLLLVDDEEEALSELAATYKRIIAENLG